jgi:hypothetical protein
MKKLSQSTKPAKVKERVADLQLVEARYRLLKPVLDHLTLGQDGIQYCAYGVIKAQIFQLTRRAERERYLHLIAFIAHQYYRLHDNLVDALLTSLQSFHNNALREHKDQCYVRREQRNESLKVLVGFLDHGVLEILAQIGAVAKNSELTDSEKVQRICALLTDNQVTQSLDPEQLAELKATLVTELSEEDYYLILSSKSVRMQNRFGPILKAVTFLAEQSAKDLHRAMEHFRLKDGAIDKTAPVDFLTPDDRTAVSRNGRFSLSLYKALLFLQVQSAIKSGTLNLEHSYKYRPLDAYLIDRERWQRDKPLPEKMSDAARSLQIIPKVSPFAGTQFEATVTSSDIELSTLLLELRHGLKAAGWIEIDQSDLSTIHGEQSSVGGAPLVKIHASRDSRLLDVANVLASALNEQKIAAIVLVTGIGIARENTINILVGPKLGME